MNSSFSDAKEYIYISEPQVDCFYSEIVKSCDPVTASNNLQVKESKYESILPVITEENIGLNESDIIHEIDEFDYNETKREEIEDYTIKNENPTAVDSDEIFDGFRCHICSYLLPSSRTLRHHLVETHAVVNSLSYFCPLCEHECWSEKQLNYHLNLHHGIKRADLACNVCGMELSSKSEVKAHQRKHILQYRCQSCPLKYGAKHLLLLHSQDHIAKLKPYSCCLCGRRFKHVKAYFLHEWRHSKQACTEPMCKNEFDDESYLLIHLQKVHKIKDIELKNIVSSKDELDRNIDFLLCLSSKKNIIKYIDVENCNEDNYLLFYTIIEMDDSAFMKKENWSEIKWKMCSDGELSYNDLCRLKEQLEEIVLNYNIKEEKSIFEDEAEVIELENLLYRRQSKHTCGLCNTSFSSFELYHNHLRSHIKTFKCHTCSRSYRSLKLLRRHCTLRCSKDDHVSSSDESALTKCPECGKLCSSRKALRVHKELKHKTSKKPKCKFCQKSFTTKGHLNEHLYIFHKNDSDNNFKKKFECTICDKALISEKNYKLHMRLHDESSLENEELVSLSCPKCDKKFTRPQMLNRHFAQHGTEHKCSVCSKNFPSASKLSSHLNSHDHDLKQRFSCKHCNLKFSYKSLLRVHLLTHTGEKPFVCEKCGKKFKRLQQCRVHNKLVHSEKELQCKECLKYFGTASNLMRHRIAFHLNLKRWICGICSHSYGYSQDLRNHLKKLHQYDLKNIEYKSKKSNSEVYIIPELNSYKISSDMQQKIEFIHKEECLKLEAFMLNKDIPINNEELLKPSHNENSYQIQSAIPTIQMQTTVHPVQLLNNSLQSVLIENTPANNIITKNICNYCKMIIMNKYHELICEICSLTFCSSSHLAAHSASHILFQCSVCSLRFASKDLCEIHIRNAHSYTREISMNQFVMQPVNSNLSLTSVPHLRSVVPNSNSVYQLIPVASVINAAGCQDHDYGIQREGSKLVYQTFNMSSNHYISEKQLQGSLMNQHSVIMRPNDSMSLPVSIIPSTNATNIEGDKILKSVTQSICQIPLVQNQMGIENNIPTSSQILIPNTGISEKALVLETGNSIPGNGNPNSFVHGTLNPLCSHEHQNYVNNAVKIESSSLKSTSSGKMDSEASSQLFASRSTKLNLGPDAGTSTPSGDQAIGTTCLTSYDVKNTRGVQNNGNTLSVNTNEIQNIKDEEEEEEEEDKEGKGMKIYVSVLNTNNPPVNTSSSGSEANSSKVFYKCRVCNKLFPTLPALERHNKIHETKKFECQLCSKSFVEKFNLKTHMLTHTKERPWECKKCDKKFRYCRDLKDHLRAHDGLLLFQCPTCDLKFLRSKDLVRHKREQHAVVKYKCEECGLEFRRKYYLEKYHMKIHNKVLPKKKKKLLNCKHCSQVLTFDHVCSHDVGKFKCSCCDKIFNKKRSLATHLRIHNLVKK